MKQILVVVLLAVVAVAYAVPVDSESASNEVAQVAGAGVASGVQTALKPENFEKLVHGFPGIIDNLISLIVGFFKQAFGPKNDS